jgi:hypothetical protein
MGDNNETPADPPYDIADCQEDDGPNSDVTGSDTGAFSGMPDWLDGMWVSWEIE